MINKKEVERIANLARLYLSDDEISRMQQDISSILQYVEKLKEVAVSDIEPISHILSIEYVTRKDIPKMHDKKENEKLLELAPHTEGGRIKVKSILK